MKISPEYLAIFLSRARCVRDRYWHVGNCVQFRSHTTTSDWAENPSRGVGQKSHFAVELSRRARVSTTREKQIITIAFRVCLPIFAAESAHYSIAPDAIRVYIDLSRKPLDAPASYIFRSDTFRSFFFPFRCTMCTLWPRGRYRRRRVAVSLLWGEREKLQRKNCLILTDALMPLAFVRAAVVFLVFFLL